MEVKSKDSIQKELEKIDGVQGVRKQPPHYVLTCKKVNWDDAQELNRKLTMSENHEDVVGRLPIWVEIEFSNPLEVFVSVDEELYSVIS